MKKMILFSLPVVALAMIMSCTKEAAPESQDSKQGQITEFKATIEDGSKTSFDGKAVSWKQGDEIAIINENGTIFRFVATSDGQTTTFTKGAGQEEFTGSVFYAVFPYTDSLTWDAGTKTATVRTATARFVAPGTFGNPYDAVMTAYTTTDELEFKNLSGMINFEIPEGLKVKTLYMYAGGQDLSAAKGAGIAIGTDGTPSVSTKPSTYNGITMSTSVTDSTYLISGKYYIPVLPGEYKNLRCKLTYDDGTVSEAFNLNAFTLERNGQMNIGKFYDGRSFYKWLTFEDGKLPATVIDKAGTVTIVDNPVKGKGNPSEKSYQCSVTDGTSSAYITVDLSGISSSIRKNIKGLKFQIIPNNPDTKTYYYTYVRYATDGALSTSGVKPSLINGKTYSSQTEYKNAVVLNFWNTLQYDASLFGVDNFETITKIQIRQSQYYNSESNLTGPFTLNVDNIGFVY